MADPVLTAGMIAEARAAGLTWAQIGSVLNHGNRNPKLAKKQAKALAREANRKAALMLSEEAAMSTDVAKFVLPARSMRLPGG